MTRGRCSQVQLRERHVTPTVCTSSSSAEPVAPLAHLQRQAPHQGSHFNVLWYCMLATAPDSTLDALEGLVGQHIAAGKVDCIGHRFAIYLRRPRQICAWWSCSGCVALCVSEFTSVTRVDVVYIHLLGRTSCTAYTLESDRRPDKTTRKLPELRGQCVLLPVYAPYGDKHLTRLLASLVLIMLFVVTSHEMSCNWIQAL